VHKQGASDHRARFYPGFKEEIYLGDFEPDSSVLTAVGVAQDGRPLVVARTPPSRAAYHHFGNPLFREALDTLATCSDARIVTLARYAEQRAAIRALGLANVHLPERAVDSRSLIYHADLVIGAGGTMTREAALMGVPTYSLFAGEQPAVDRQLERQGHLRRLRTPDQLPVVRHHRAEARSIANIRARAHGLVEVFVEATCGPAPDSHEDGAS
jgi:predicted glycosyltransferase